MTNIFNMFLARCWRLGTSSMPYYNFIKMILRDLAIFYSWYLPFWIVPYSPFRKNETLKSWHNWLLKTTWNLASVLQIVRKNWFMKIVPLTYIHQLAEFGDLIICSSKDIFKNALCLIYLYSSWRHWFGKSRDRQIWISWERNIAFLRNKKILNLCLTWHILRSCCFVAKVTFKHHPPPISVNSGLIN